MSSYWMTCYWMSSSKTFWKLLCGEYIHRTTLTTVYMYHLELYTPFSWNSLPKLCWKKMSNFRGGYCKKLNSKKSWLPKIVRSRDIVMKMLGKWSHGSNWLTDTIYHREKTRLSSHFPKKCGGVDIVKWVKTTL